MTKFLEALVAKLPAPLQPYAKAIVPLAFGAAVIVQDLTITVAEVNELKVLAFSVAYSLAVLAVPALGYINPRRGYIAATAPAEEGVSIEGHFGTDK
jgi:hypothetical protein